MLFKLLKKMIERGHTEDLLEKLNVFYAVDSITKEQYDELLGLLNKGE